MVRKVLSKYATSPPIDDNSERKILTSAPLYSRSDVIEALQHKGVNSITRQCTRDVRNLNLTDELIELIKATVETGSYRDSEWCTDRPNGNWFACDSYTVKWLQYVPTAHKNMIFIYFVKFAIGKQGNVILLISCHDPRVG